MRAVARRTARRSSCARARRRCSTSPRPAAESSSTSSTSTASRFTRRRRRRSRARLRARLARRGAAASAASVRSSLDGDGALAAPAVPLRRAATACCTSPRGPRACPRGRAPARQRLSGARLADLPPAGRQRSAARRARRRARNLYGLMALASHHRRRVPRPRPDLHRRGPARRARARPRGDRRATWRAASSATGAAGA